MPSSKRILVTAALPYANGDIHLGHLVEQCLTDFWARFQRMKGHECRFICADDTHGTPVMLKARADGVTPEKLIDEVYEKHVEDLKAFGIAHDYYSSTHTPENQEIANAIYEIMRDKGHLENKTIQQFYCEHDKMFLPDRFVKGTCPRCGATDQNGDSCDKCGATYETTEVKNPYCSICGNTPVEKDTDHLYFKLNDFRDFLNKWVQDHTPASLHGKLAEWLKDGELKDWCISRDAPYFGFEIPDRPGKFFYVWLDAPVGYISSTKKWAQENGQDFESYWKDPNTEIYHVIGKDIVYFHTLFWPAMLKVSGFTLPQKVMVHGFLTVNGAKMSKSKGTFVPARVFKNHIEPTYLRYFLACKLSGDIDDFDLSYDEFANRVNSDLIGKITNIASRGAQMLQKKMDGKMGALPEDGRAIVNQLVAKKDQIADFYENQQFAKAMLEIREMASLVNKYFDEKEPWKLIKTDAEATRGILTTLLNSFRILAMYLKPVIPDYVAKAEALFQESDWQWSDIGSIVENQELATFEHLAQRVDAKAFDKIEEETKKVLGVAPDSPKEDKKKSADKKKESTSKKDSKYINFDEFSKVELKVGVVKEAVSIKEAKKLVQLTVDMGEEKPRNIISGIKESYADPSVLVGKRVVVVANLAPRKMKFGISEGMILASGEGGSDLVLVDPGPDCAPGTPVA